MVNKYGKLLRELRKAKGMSLRELGEKLGVSTQFVCNVELGNKHPFNLQRNIEVCRILECQDRQHELLVAGVFYKNTFCINLKGASEEVLSAVHAVGDALCREGVRSD